MSVVISDTSPVRVLDHIGKIGLFQHLFGSVLVPPAVASELSHPSGQFSPIDVSKFAFITIRTPSNTQQVAVLRQSLDAGEAEAIALAIELRADMIVIDELAGRAVADASGIPRIGVLGILTRAKDKRLISAARPLVDRLRAELRFHVSDKLYTEYLRSLGE